jgi:hypothetical protein
VRFLQHERTSLGRHHHAPSAADLRNRAYQRFGCPIRELPWRPSRNIASGLLSDMSDNCVLQIIPQLPGTLDGLGDYALTLARVLSSQYGLTTVFAVARETSVKTKDGFQVISSLGRDGVVQSLAKRCDHVILHYVNYGYQARGVPFFLRRFARQLRGQLRGRWVTNFHEIYASGPPWKSEFWLHPLQVKIARDLIDLSDTCFVSNIPIEKRIHLYDPRKKVQLAPVMSNFGEPKLTDFSAASPKRWAICGGAGLIARSLRSFEQLHPLIPGALRPDHLDVIGGRDENSTRALIERLASRIPGSCGYHPEVTASEASALLTQCSFVWLDYFPSGKVPGMILKSSIFAACGAHGVVPVLSHQEDALAVDGDPFPGWWFMTPSALHLPVPNRLGEIREKIYAWYQAHAASPRLAQLYAEALA